MKWTYKATIDRWIDGDTVDLTVDLGFRVNMTMRVRLVGPGGRYFNAPEVRGPEREEGKRATAFVEDYLPAGTPVYIETFKDDSQGKFGRWLACIRPRQGDHQRPEGIDVATLLVVNDLGEYRDA